MASNTARYIRYIISYTTKRHYEWISLVILLLISPSLCDGDDKNYLNVNGIEKNTIAVIYLFFCVREKWRSHLAFPNGIRNLQQDRIRSNPDRTDHGSKTQSKIISI